MAIKEIKNAQFINKDTGEVFPVEVKNIEFIDEWVWVKAYKDTDKNMRCRNFQYNMDEEFFMSEEDVNLCESGFHACTKLHDVKGCYCDVFNDRYFEVEVLIQKNKQNKMKYGDSKVAGKAIRFVRELTDEEIYLQVVRDNSYTINEFIKMRKYHWNHAMVQLYIKYKIYMSCIEQEPHSPINFSDGYISVIDKMIVNLSRAISYSQSIYPIYKEFINELLNIKYTITNFTQTQGE